MVSDEIRCSTGERLQRVMAALESRSVPVESLHVVDSEPSFPLAWRRLLRKLGAQFDGQEPQADNGSDLAKLQIGRAHVCTPVTNAQLVCRLLLAKKKNKHK